MLDRTLSHTGRNDDLILGNPKMRPPPPLMTQNDRMSIHATLSEAEIQGGACAAPGTRQRIVQIRTLREAGYSLDEIAARFGITRERVRQILRAHGAPDPELVAEARRQRAALLAESRVDELLALWRAGHEPGSAASSLGLQTAACKSTIARFATDVDKAARRASLSGARGTQTYSDRDIIVALRAVSAALARVPSAKEYALLARGLELPSLPTVLNRMGGWTRAVEAAGMTPLGAPSAGTRQRRWTDTACLAALRRVVGELGEVPSVLAYERHAAGREDLPSAATLRNRLGRWSAITAQVAAERELAHHAQTAGFATALPARYAGSPAESPLEAAGLEAS